MDFFAPPALQPRNMNEVPPAPLPMSPMPELPIQAAPIAVPPGADPARWLQLPVETQMQYWNMLQGMESANSGMPSYGPPPMREAVPPATPPPKGVQDSIRF